MCVCVCVCKYKYPSIMIYVHVSIGVYLCVHRNHPADSYNACGNASQLCLKYIFRKSKVSAQYQAREQDKT